jgi:hypothetical protein
VDRGWEACQRPDAETASKVSSRISVSLSSSAQTKLIVTANIANLQNLSILHILSTRSRVVHGNDAKWRMTSLAWRICKAYWINGIHCSLILKRLSYNTSKLEASWFSRLWKGLWCEHYDAASGRFPDSCQ